MRPWWQLATRNWRTRPARSALAVLAVSLGVAVVVWITCSYESVRRGVNDVVLQWIGRSHVIIEPVEGVWAVFGQDVEEPVSKVPGVLHTTVRTREYVEAARCPDGPPPVDPNRDRQGAANSESDFVRIEIAGVVPEKEHTFRTYKLDQGRFLSPSDEDAALVERLLARELGLSLGDVLCVRGLRPPQTQRRLRIVGIVDRRRASANQPLMAWSTLENVQSLVGLPGKVKAVDVILADPDVANIRRVAADVRGVIDRRNQVLKAGDFQTEALQVKTTEAQHRKLGAAQGLLQFIMVLLSCVVLLTAFFIIMATMGMGVTERVTELGLLRCIGVTRRQMCALVVVQTVPLGVLGILIGVPLGLLLQWLTIRGVPDYIGQMAISPWGVSLAVLGGLLTTLLGAAAPAARAFSVSPVEATRPYATQRRLRGVWLAAILGCVLIAGHEAVNRAMSQSPRAAFDAMAVCAVLLLYFGCALLVPAVVVVLGRAAARGVAAVLRIHGALLGEEIDKAPFRSGAICCGLMVALSLIVGLVVWGESVKQGWQFPKEFPDAMLYTYSPVPLEEARALRNVDGVAEFTVVDDFPFSLTKPSLLRPFRSLLEQFSRFLAIDPEEGLSIVKLAFIEGDERNAVARLKAGGHILITREFSQARDAHVDDELTIWVRGTPATFTIAGVVASPGVDIAISFFNATSYFQTYAVGAIVGTLDDANRLFGRSYGTMILFNFDLAADEPAETGTRQTHAFAGQTQDTKAGRPSFALGPGPIPGDGPEERVINEMLERLGYPPKAFVTARELKRQIDRNINRVTLLLSAIPVIALVVAALGLANLMAAGVASRARPLAVLRAVGMTRGQMSRMVIGEAVVFGLVGSVMGLALGLLLGRTSNLMTELLTGYQPAFRIPWTLVSAGAALTTLMCLLAALIPARYAGRSNIVSVLSSG